MISLKLIEQLKVLKESKRIPNVVLITGLYDHETKSAKLIEAARVLEGSEVSEAKGSVIFLESEGASSIKVDDVRDLLKNISLRSWDTKSGRFILVPRAELLTVQSSNALLKSLEESPEGTYFILGAPSKRSLLKTILSRSFILNEDTDDLVSREGVNVFYEAFFIKNYDPFAKIARGDLKYEWQEFSLRVKEDFVTKVYSGDLNKSEWHRLFNFMDDMDEKIEANMDTKWIASAIERFSFNG